jgi:WD40 repeat protein
MFFVNLVFITSFLIAGGQIDCYPDGSKVVSASSSDIKIWDVKTSRLLKTITWRSLSSINISPDGKYLACSDAMETIKIFDSESGREIKTLTMVDEHSKRQVQFSPSGSQLAISGNNITIYALNSWEILKTLPGSSAFSYSPDGQYIASNSNDYEINIISIATSETIRTFRGHTKPINSIIYSPNGLYLASCSEDGSVIIWDINSAEEVVALSNPWSIDAVCFSPNSRFMVFSASGAIRNVRFQNSYTLPITIVNLEDRSRIELRSTEGRNEGSDNIKFSPDGNSVFSFDGNIVKIWNANTGILEKTFS